MRRERIVGREGRRKGRGKGEMSEGEKVGKRLVGKGEGGVGGRSWSWAKRRGRREGGG